MSSRLAKHSSARCRRRIDLMSRTPGKFELEREKTREKLVDVSRGTKVMQIRAEPLQ